MFDSVKALLALPVVFLTHCVGGEPPTSPNIHLVLWKIGSLVNDLQLTRVSITSASSPSVTRRFARRLFAV